MIRVIIKNPKKSKQNKGNTKPKRKRVTASMEEPNATQPTPTPTNHPSAGATVAQGLPPQPQPPSSNPKKRPLNNDSLTKFQTL